MLRLFQEKKITFYGSHTMQAVPARPTGRQPGDK